MAEEGIKDFTVNWLLGGLLLVCLLSFSISFMYNNNANALDDGTKDVFEETNAVLVDNLTYSRDGANSLMNITSNTNPEVSDLGSRDSVSVSFNSVGEATGFWENSKKLLSWVFSGTTGVILMGTLGSIIIFLAVFHIWRFIKNGI